MNTARIDPTRTTTLRARFAAEITRRFKKLNRLIYQLLVVEDALGLRSNNQVTVVPTQMFATLNEGKEFSSTQVNLPQSIGKIVLALGQQISPDDLAGKGLEDEPHITVRFGLHADSAEEVRELIQGQPPIEATLGGVGFFPGEEFDVVFVAVFSVDLRRINRVLANLPHTDTTATYKPHATIGYVKPGLGSHYAALLNQTALAGELSATVVRFHTVLFSNKERNKVAIPLLGPQFTLNTRWRFLTDEQQLDAFVAWLQVTIAKEIIADTTDKWLEKYIQAAYVKGMNRAFVDVKKPALWTGISPTDSKLDFFEGSRSEFLRQSFGRPVSVNRVKLLASRSFNDLKGITDKMSAEISRNLVDGMIQGLSPRDVARTMSETITKLGRNRALVISRTEVIRAHNEGALDALEELGVEEVGVMVEWSTAKDGRVCEECAPLQGIVLKTKEAHGMLPRHPNCFVSPKVYIYSVDGWKPIGKIRVGDLVLTHLGRFREVTQLHRNRGWDELLVDFKIKWKGQLHKVKITGDHPVLVSGEWKAAKEIEPGDKVHWLSSNCKGCGADLPVDLKYCGVACQWKDAEHRKNITAKNRESMLEQYANGGRDGKEITQKAHERVRELIALGEFDFPRVSGEANGSKQPQAREKNRQSKLGDKNPMRKHPEIGRANGKALAEFLRQNPEKHANHIMAQRGYKTKIERAMEEALAEAGIEAAFQHYAEGLWIDFAIVEKQIAIECDGAYWHQDKKAQRKRDRRLKKQGWTVLHFSCKEITKGIGNCIAKVQRVLNNHNGEYKFAQFEVVKVTHKRSGLVKLYNISVAEDESYIAKGCVVHNCRCAIIPANVGEKTEGQKRGRARITKAIEASVRAEAPKKDKRQGIAALKRKSRWTGATKEIDKKRPRKQL